MNFLDKKLIGVFVTAFAFAVIVSAPISFDDTKYDFVDSIASAFGDVGGGDCGGCGGPEGGGGQGDGPEGGGDPERPEPDPIVCTLVAGPTLITKGDTATLTWTTTNAQSAEINRGIGTVSPTRGGSVNVSPEETTTYTMTARSAGFTLGTLTLGGRTVTCQATIMVKEPAPGTPDIQIIKRDAVDKDDMQTVTKGGTAKFQIIVKNTGDVDLKNVVVTDPREPRCDKTIGALAQGAQKAYTCNSPNVQNAFTNVANVEGRSVETNERVTDSDPTQVKVTTPTPNAPSCDSFTASPNSLPDGGGSVTLAWETSNAGTVSINNGVGTVSADGSKVVSVTDDVTYTLTATKANFDPVTCSVSISVDEDDTPLCEGVWISASDTDVDEGDEVTIRWGWTQSYDDVDINNGIGSVDNNDSERVTINDDETYTITVTRDGDSEECDRVHIDAEEDNGGGGGGSSNPRCDLDISDRTIRAGEEVTLSWETSRGRELTIYEGDEDDGEKIFETDDEDEVEEGEIRVRPTRDTEYTLVVERGSRDRECDVEVEVEEDDVVITAARSQGQVAGISLTQVPYTGFEAGPMLTFIFYALLAVWGLFVAYVLVLREKSIFGFSFAGAFTEDRVITEDLSTESDANVQGASQASTYVASATSAPSNLPTGDMHAMFGYTSDPTVATRDVALADDPDAAELQELENRAHDQHVLLSSDAMRHLIAVCPKDVRRVAFLDQIISEARVSFPAEDGWIVLNLDRMTGICDKRKSAAPALAHTTQQTVAVAPEKKLTDTPTGAGSLAESMMTGNILAAYQMIGNRPMVALADAAADLDALYRVQKGEQVAVSDMLKNAATNVSTEQLESAIEALTCAIDGTYTDEAAAVKMAILKATKALA